MKVLIVDDEPNILLSLEYLMKREGYRVFIARDGDEALGIIRQEVPDLLLLDVMMQRVDGYEVCQFVKQSPEYRHCKVIFLSAKSKEADIRKGLELGADLYLSKPFSTRELVAKVHKLMARTTLSGGQ